MSVFWWNVSKSLLDRFSVFLMKPAIVWVDVVTTKKLNTSTTLTECSKLSLWYRVHDERSLSSVIIGFGSKLIQCLLQPLLTRSRSWSYCIDWCVKDWCGGCWSTLMLCCQVQWLGSVWCVSFTNTSLSASLPPVQSWSLSPFFRNYDVSKLSIVSDTILQNSRTASALLPDFWYLCIMFPCRYFQTVMPCIISSDIAEWQCSCVVLPPGDSFYITFAVMSMDSWDNSESDWMFTAVYVYLVILSKF